MHFLRLVAFFAAPVGKSHIVVGHATKGYDHCCSSGGITFLTAVASAERFRFFVFRFVFYILQRIFRVNESSSQDFPWNQTFYFKFT